MTRKFCLLVALAIIAVPAIGQTPDGETPAEETVCDTEAGAAFGLCNAYCEAMDCHLANDGDPDTAPNASARACDRVRGNFFKQTERDLPCENMVACPCSDPSLWDDPDFDGLIWPDFANGVLIPTSCIDSGDLTKLVQGDVGEFFGAAVDGAECHVFETDPDNPFVTLMIDPGQVEPCRDLLRLAAANVLGLVCTP